MEKEPKLYEIAYLLTPAVSDEEALNFQQTLKNEIQKMDGIIGNEGSIFRRKLSYPIKKMREAYLGSFKFKLKPEKIIDLKTKATRTEILRFLIIETKHVEIRPQPIRFTTRPDTDTPKVLTEENKKIEPTANIEEIDKKLEEILGK